jgi:hypothetical protein
LASDCCAARVQGRLGEAVQKLVSGTDVFQKQLMRIGKASTARLQFLDETNLSLASDQARPLASTGSCALTYSHVRL